MRTYDPVDSQNLAPAPRFIHRAFWSTPEPGSPLAGFACTGSDLRWRCSVRVLCYESLSSCPDPGGPWPFTVLDLQATRWSLRVELQAHFPPFTRTL